MAARPAAREKVIRDQRIVADRARGLAWATIAGRHGLSERQCQTIWRDHLAREPLPHQVDLEESLRETLAQLDAVVEDAALLAETTRNDSVRLGAIKMRYSALTGKTQVMHACGLLPRYEHGLHALDFERLGETLCEVLAEHRASRELVDDLLARMEPLAAAGGCR